ncbi:RNA polymerase sigma factor [Kangiella shandongensis]|uniref:RNA polymerase sigma factor n=1 Tax=Kangiella shandongensis TaxID=2763258 RepID=UPI001CC08136|nr:RNA polymerase sigma factor [Kangiella shandongensis]
MEQQISKLYHQESRWVLATLIRLLGDFDLAEEALHEAFIAALNQWPETGIPEKPREWLVSTGRFKAIDHIRRQQKLRTISHQLSEQQIQEVEQQDFDTYKLFHDDQLRLIFTCCHPSLTTEAQIALTLREICGLTTEEIAQAFLTKAPTIAQRIVRAKNKIRDANIPYEVPHLSDIPERLDIVLHVIYLLFNEGYNATQGELPIRVHLVQHAIELCQQLEQLMPRPETKALLALILIQHSRRDARHDDNGDIITLEYQDRSLWHQDDIQQGQQLLVASLQSRIRHPFTLQAAIAAVHAEAKSFMQTDWAQIIELYDVLLSIQPSPVIELNRAVAIAMHHGPQSGLTLVNDLIQRKQLLNYHLLYAAQGDFYTKLEQHDKARQAFVKALSLTEQEAEKRFIQERIKKIS